VYFDQLAGEIDTMWLIPSVDISKNAVALERHYRIVASRTLSSGDKWAKYKVSPQEMVAFFMRHLTNKSIKGQG
jgi:hypothetical protein